ncbi:hypothetical protein D3C72_1218610 [compost metagenome]
MLHQDMCYFTFCFAALISLFSQCADIIFARQVIAGQLCFIVVYIILQDGKGIHA